MKDKLSFMSTCVASRCSLPLKFPKMTYNNSFDVVPYLKLFIVPSLTSIENFVLLSKS